MFNRIVIFFVLVVYIYVYFLYKKRLYFATFYWLAVFTLTFLIPNLAPSLNTYGYVISSSTYNRLNYYYLIILFVFIAFNLLFTMLPIKGLSMKSSKLSYSRLAFVFNFYCGLSFFILAIVGLDSLKMGASKAIQGSNPLVSFLAPSIVFGLILSALIKLFFCKNHKQKMLSIIHVIYSILFGVLLVFARRQVIYPIIITIVFAVFIYNKKPKLRYLLLIACIIIFIALPLMISIRTNGFILGIRNFGEVLTGHKDILLSYLIMSTDVSWSYSLAAIIIQYNVKISLLTLMRPITMIIPRSIWTDKPLPASLQLVRMLGISDNPNMSIPPGLVGESYSYLGIIGVIIAGMLWGIVTAIIDHKLNPEDNYSRQEKSVMILSLIILSVQFIAGALRGDTATTLQETQFVVFPFLMLLYISKLIKFRNSYY